VADVPASCLGGRDFPINPLPLYGVYVGVLLKKLPSQPNNIDSRLRRNEIRRRKPPFAARAQPSLSRIARFLGISRPKAGLPGIPFQSWSRYLAERTSPGVGPSIASVYFNRRMAASDFGGQFFARVGD
jgi:hypothetical protein